MKTKAVTTNVAIQKVVMMKKIFQRGLIAAGSAAFCLLPLSAPASNQLPTIGDTTSSVISLQQEYQLGRTWARLLRGSTREYHDPVVYNYLSDTLWNLAATSQLADRRLQLIVLDNPTLNAFAVPGGIVGINAGLVLAAENEQQLASVVAHELAHLSQRHYAQQLEQQRINQPLILAGVLASIVAGAASGGQAGVAGLSTSIAAGQQLSLNFSRRNEQEADRIGMLNLVASGYDPNAMHQMFGQLQRSSRFLGQRPPEFLLTHPVTESRIADAKNRAKQLASNGHRAYTPEFGLIQTRIKVSYSKQPADLIKEYEAQSQDPLSQYGIMLAATRHLQFDKAMQAYDKLPASFKNQLAVNIGYVELLLAKKDYPGALAKLDSLYQLYPDSYPVRLFYGRALMNAGDYSKAVSFYENLTESQPQNSRLWYELAELYGLAGDTKGLHLARIEYFLAVGQVDRAMQQIDIALKNPGLSSHEITNLNLRKKSAEAIREQIKAL